MFGRSRQICRNNRLSTLPSECSEKVQHVLLVEFAQPIEQPDHLIRLRRQIYPSSWAGMGLNRLEQVLCPAIVQEKDPLSKAPQGRGAEFVAGRVPLVDVVRQAWPHIVNR